MSQRVRHALIDDSCYVAQQEISILAKLLTERSNREFAQRARRVRERIEMVAMEFEGDGMGVA